MPDAGSQDGGSAGVAARLKQATPIPLDAQLDCAPGELLALVGPSGSGKTTILRCIAGLDRPAAGRIAVAGETWFDAEAGISLSPQVRAVGIVFQNYALFPHMTALANVATAIPYGDAQARAARARMLLDLVHLAGLENRRPAALSGGQQQRVALARALAREPSVLLLDEPFSAVDQVTRRKLQRELVLLRRQVRVPIILVTHDLDEAGLLADRMCILHHGRTLQTAAPADLTARPATPLVARLIDHRNVFDGVVERHAAETETTFLRWHGHVLEAVHRPTFPERAKVCWVIPQASVILHRRDRPSRGERENPLGGTIAEIVLLGDSTNLTMAVDGAHGASLSFSVPTHVARRNALALGVTIKVSLLKEGIHLMPWEPSILG